MLCDGSRKRHAKVYYQEKEAISFVISQNKLPVTRTKTQALVQR
jgi:hypothetical protein